MLNLWCERHITIPNWNHSISSSPLKKKVQQLICSNNYCCKLIAANFFIAKNAALYLQHFKVLQIKCCKRNFFWILGFKKRK
jgi:hypothetical protein